MIIGRFFLPVLRQKHLLLDFTLAFASFIAAYFLRVGFFFSSDVLFGPYAFFSLLASLVWGGVLLSAGYYDMVRKKRFIRALSRALGGLSALGVLIFLHFFLQKLVFSRLMLLYSFFLGFFCLSVTHRAFEAYLFGQKKKEMGPKVLIIGTHEPTEAFIQHCVRDPYVDFVFMGAFSPYGVYKNLTKVPILGKLNQLEKTIDEKKPQGLLLAHGHEHLVNIYAMAQKKELEFFVLPQIQQLPHEKITPRPCGTSVLYHMQ